MDKLCNSNIYLIKTIHVVNDYVELEFKIRNADIYELLFTDEKCNLDFSIINPRIWDIDDFSFAAFLPKEIVESIALCFNKFGLKCYYTNIDYQLFQNTCDLLPINNDLRFTVIQYLISIYDVNDVLDKMNSSQTFKLSEVDKLILLGIEK